MHTPLILTVQLDATSQLFFDEKRKEHFPPERNFLSAHLTLFHHLPDDEPVIEEALSAICQQQQNVSLFVSKPLNMGRGVAYKIDSVPLISLHKHLRHQWKPLLTAQDQQGLWPHITVQNKVSPENAKHLLTNLQTDFQPFTATAEGFILWRYLKGPWQLYRRLPFAG